ncbi:Tn3 family transposase [Streptomyces inhibens]|uniref:Tn3 family transposase n=1 Tax=Streptomyces inhibens TaxID=2293571 RepID=UPI00379452ED
MPPQPPRQPAAGHIPPQILIGLVAARATEIVRQLQEEGHGIDPEDLAHISPYLTEHIRRFGAYSTHELGLQPEAYDPHLDVGVIPLRGDGPPAPDGYGQAA